MWLLLVFLLWPSRFFRRRTARAWGAPACLCHVSTPLRWCAAEVPPLKPPSHPCQTVVPQAGGLPTWCAWLVVAPSQLAAGIVVPVGLTI